MNHVLIVDDEAENPGASLEEILREEELWRSCTAGTAAEAMG